MPRALVVSKYFYDCQLWVGVFGRGALGGQEFGKGWCHLEDSNPNHSEYTPKGKLQIRKSITELGFFLKV